MLSLLLKKGTRSRHPHLVRASFVGIRSVSASSAAAFANHNTSNPNDTADVVFNKGTALLGGILLMGTTCTVAAVSTTTTSEENTSVTSTRSVFKGSKMNLFGSTQATARCESSQLRWLWPWQKSDSSSSTEEGTKSSSRFHVKDVYDIEQVLGEGGYGLVYKARRKSDGLRVALKTMPREYTDRKSVV